MTCSMISSRIFSRSTSGACWVDTTTVSTRTGLPSVVLHGHLALAVGPEVVERALAANLTEALDQPVREHDRQRHQLLGLVAGVAEHEALVAGAAGVHAHGDVRRLLVDRGHDRARLVVEAELGAGVADVLDGLTHGLGEVDVGLGGDLAGDDGQAGGDQRLAGHPAVGILGEDGVQDRIRDLVGDLVGVRSPIPMKPRRPGGFGVLRAGLPLPFF